MPMPSLVTDSARQRRLIHAGRFYALGRVLSDRPLDGNEGAGGDQLLEVLLPDDCRDFSYYELVEEGKPYREWCIPAEIINRSGTVRLVTTE
jgi:hypothetical protein